jgi:hypothetical protein
MIELFESNVVARRPTDIDLDEEAATPRPPTEYDETEPYQTPVALTPANRNNKNKARAMAEPEETPSGVEMVEESDIEMITLKDKFVGKERKALVGALAADRVHHFRLIHHC